MVSDNKIRDFKDLDLLIACACVGHWYMSENYAVHTV